jgi:hypothetical protein
MHARVSIFEAENPEQVDGMLRQVREVVLPQAKQMDGFKGLIHPSAWNRYSRKFKVASNAQAISKIWPHGIQTCRVPASYL